MTCEIQLRLEAVAQGLDVAGEQDEPLVFDVNGVEVTAIRTSWDDADIRIFASSRRDAPEEVVQHLVAWLETPEAPPPQPTASFSFAFVPRREMQLEFGWKSAPREVALYFAPIMAELRTAGARFVQIVRWQHNAAHPAQALSRGRINWTLDGETWGPTPTWGGSLRATRQPWQPDSCVRVRAGFGREARRAFD